MKKITVVLAVLFCLAGVGLIVYPTISDIVNKINSSSAIQDLVVQMEDIPDEELLEQMRLAQEYNERLRSNRFDVPNSELADYYSILDFANNMMGYIEIEKIGVRLPIYHGVSSDVLAKGVGHLPESSFPIGGEGNHAVLTAHTGLPSAKLFTDLVKLEEGDIFTVYVANEVLSYKVDQMKTIAPYEIDDIASVEGKDYCTLATCTPYGINSHRLLVRGERTENPEVLPQVNALPVDIEEVMRFPWIALAVLVSTSISAIRDLIVINKRRRKKKRNAAV